MNSDEQFLTGQGGVHKNSLCTILNTEITDKITSNENDENNHIQIIKHSPYFDDKQFKDKIESISKHSFAIYSTNIESVRSKIDQLKIVIKDLKNENFEFDAICLQECYINDQVDTSQIQLDNYHAPIIQGSSCTVKGGLLVYIHSKYPKPKLLMKLDTYSNWEGQIIKVEG